MKKFFIFICFLLFSFDCFAQSNLKNYDDDLHMKCVENREYCIKLAKKGNAIAQNAYGVILHLKDRNYEQALIWYKKSAMQKNADACHNLASMYFYGEGIEEDNYESIKWNTLAIKYGNSDKYVWLQLGYANYYAPINNYKQALEWFLKAAKEQDAEAQYMIGVCYENGNGVGKNLVEAFNWYKKAAEGGRGTFQAKYTVGTCYYYGKGTEQNYKEAVKWFYELSEYGFNEAGAKGQFALGICFLNGQGISKDLDSAKSYIQKAADNGYEVAIEFLKDNESSLSNKPDNSSKIKELLGELKNAQAKYNENFQKLQNMQYNVNPYMDYNVFNSMLLNAQNDCFFWIQQVTNIKSKLNDLGYYIN